MELFTKFELIIMISIISFLMFIVLLLSIIEVISNRKEKKKANVVEIEEEEEKSIEEEEIAPVKLEITSSETATPQIEMEVSAPADAENILIEDMEDIKPEEVQEVAKDFDDGILIEDMDEMVFTSGEMTISPEPVEIELNAREKAQIELMKIEEALENEKTLEETIESFEASEEENAIISYQELLSVTSELSIVNSDEGNEPISISEVYEKFDQEENNKVALDGIETLEEVKENMIMPSTLNENESMSEIQLENTANLEKLDKEIRKTNKFLNILNELKKNLE